MIKFLFALLLLAPTASLAREPFDATLGMSRPESVRLEYVFRIAETVCPKMAAIPSRDVPRYFSLVQTRMKLSDDELTALLNHCMIYVQGTKNQH